MNLKKLILVSITALLSLSLLGACSNNGEDNDPKDETPMTREELIEAAKAEGKVVIYSTTSRISRAAEEFTKLYGIEVEASNLKDGELIEKVSREVSGNIAGADFVLAQDSGRVFGQLINTGYLVNYVPESMKNVIPEHYQQPLHFQLVNKVFTFNNEKTQTPVITNVWELTEPQWKGLVQFKDPNQEGVNFNFLTMITNDEWSAKLAQSYKNLYGTDIELTTDNAGYEWIKRFFDNGVVLGNSDTTISENIGIKGQPNTTLGLFVYSKTRFDAAKNLALQPMTEIEPFAGFYYPIFAQMTKNAKNPNAAKLFIEYLLTAEGFAPWSSDVGSYSSNPNVPVNDGDHPVAFWEERLVPEDPEFIFRNRSKVEEFVNRVINN